MDRRRKFSDEQIQFVRESVTGLSNENLTEQFNSTFGMNISIKQMIAIKKNYKLRSGLNTKFVKGNPPHNKGKKGVGGWKPTQFKKGNRSANYMPVGSERVNTDGYVDVKVADPNKWRQKHILIWEAENGPIPDGHVLIFGDKNPLNVCLENLILVTRKQLLILNRNRLIQEDIDLTKTGILVADVCQALYSLKKREANKRNTERNSIDES